MAIQEGTAYWVSAKSPNTTFEPTYTVDLVVDDKVADDFQARGFRVKDLKVGEQEVGRAITMKRKVNGPNGMIRPAPHCLDKDKMPMDELIGNGSRVIVQYKEWETSNKYGDFKGLDFKGIQVLDLVSFESADGEEFEAIEGGEEF